MSDKKFYLFCKTHDCAIEHDCEDRDKLDHFTANHVTYETVYNSHECEVLFCNEDYMHPGFISEFNVMYASRIKRLA